LPQGADEKAAPAGIAAWSKVRETMKKCGRKAASGTRPLLVPAGAALAKEILLAPDR